MNIYFQKKFLPVFALFFAVVALTLLQQNSFILITINSKFILVVNGILFMIAFFNFKRISQVDLSKPNVMVRSVMTGAMLKFIIFGGAALWYVIQKKHLLATII